MAKAYLLPLLGLEGVGEGGSRCPSRSICCTALTRPPGRGLEEDIVGDYGFLYVGQRPQVFDGGGFGRVMWCAMLDSHFERLESTVFVRQWLEGFVVCCGSERN